MMGIAHENAELIIDNFTGDDAEKQRKVDYFVSIKALEPVPLTDAEKEALEALETEKKQQEQDAEEAAKFEDEKKEAFLGADFSDMNKAPMIKFAEQWEVSLSGDTANDIRAELVAVQDSYLAEKAE